MGGHGERLAGVCRSDPPSAHVVEIRVVAFTDHRDHNLVDAGGEQLVDDTVRHATDRRRAGEQEGGFQHTPLGHLNGASELAGIVEHGWRGRHRHREKSRRIVGNDCSNSGARYWLVALAVPHRRVPDAHAGHIRDCVVWAGRERTKRQSKLASAGPRERRKRGHGWQSRSWRPEEGGRRACSADFPAALRSSE